MSNTINLTACDNQLIIVAFYPTGSYEVCSILSGNSYPVNININLVEGAYTTGLTLNGVNNPLSGNYNVAIPSGTYNLSAVGLNWGGPTAFEFTLNGGTYSLPFQQNGELGVVWSPSVIENVVV